jgi:hypothetical protein
LTAQFDTAIGTWSGNYTNTRPNGACTFTNQGTMSLDITAPTATGATTFPAKASMAGFEIRNLSNCAVQNRLPGQAKANLAVTNAAVTGDLPVTINGIQGTLDFPFTATISGTTLTGKWTCANCTGTFTLTKQLQ